jgi:hypothetical protein
MNHLWSANTPAHFWLCEPNPPDDLWEAAVTAALPILGLKPRPSDTSEMLRLVLGEEQFGARHWDLSPSKAFYYAIKPFLPKLVRQALRRFIRKRSEVNFQLSWPIEPRYAQFQWEVMRQVLLLSGKTSLSFRYFWPHGKRYAFSLTHDIETAEGQRHVRAVAALEESLGFRSSFAFVPEAYKLDYGLMEDLRERGFEIAVHGLKHDGKDFESQHKFMKRARRINDYLKRFKAISFHAPLTLRQPQWLQALDIDYDRSFFDTDPYEPNSGGVMSIWPFMIGHFLELPYTLPQDYTLAILLQESSPRLWQEKLAFIRHYHGMALMVTHPDYLKQKHIMQFYHDFLMEVKAAGDYWTGLPSELAHWWRERGATQAKFSCPHTLATAVLLNDCLQIYY